MMAGLLRAMVAGALALGAAPASASVTFTYTGYVVAGYDADGIFGTPDASLTGDAFTLTFSFSGNGEYEAVGTFYATLTITGNSFNTPIADQESGFIITSPNYASFAVGGNTTTGFVDFDAEGLAAPPTLDQSFSYSLGPAFYYGGTGGIFEYDCTFYSSCRSYAYLENGIWFGGTGPLAPLSPALAPSIPEPSTWVMLLLGFAGLGFAGYWTARKCASLAA
jgi:PEP-CTERM motif